MEDRSERATPYASFIHGKLPASLACFDHTFRVDAFDALHPRESRAIHPFTRGILFGVGGSKVVEGGGGIKGGTSTA